ncbi:hypothetical protein M231_01651 [Tremella mesenterica]|uniref:Uncharacterized protein n=1 Tax=Tremella mesenterica TaxID=5217 RepID=A0A4Q1BST3_TREME|nr:hypothetical protein M231_01651 [Tremella mesenterica]
MLYMSTVCGVQETRSFGSPLDPKSLLKAAGAAWSKLLNDERFKRFGIGVPRTVSVSRIEVPSTVFALQLSQEGEWIDPSALSESAASSAQGFTYAHTISGGVVKYHGS